MPLKYGPDCVDECKVLYLRYNGQHHEKIATEMNRRWAGFNERRISDWAKKYQWDLLLTKKLEAELERSGWTNAQRVFRDIDHLREMLKAQVEAHGATDTDTVKVYLTASSLAVNALARLEAERGGMETFVNVWEWLGRVAGEVNPRLAKEFVASSAEIYQRAQEFFSASKETD